MPHPKSPTLTLARQTAREKFGFKTLRPGQSDALKSLLKGRDTLAILPTGGGKSLIYQIAGLLFSGPTIVVSPLVALQKDQVEAFNKREIGRAALLNSTLTDAARDEVWQALERGEVKFLLLAPEQFAGAETLERLRALNPSLLVVDEAHCVSQWGHDFRPDYGRLGAARAALGCPPLLALTATAAPPVRAAMAENLEMRDPNVVVTGFDRPNLHLEVRAFQSDDAKTNALVEAVVEGPKPAIVYAATRAQTEELTEMLSTRGVNAGAYHAGLPAAAREAQQNAWMESDGAVMVATIAFGMGVDKPDVRAVWHHDIPGSLDAYNQEAGRAGRDRKSARAMLFYCASDLGLRRFHAGGGHGDAQTATQLVAVIADMNGHDETVSLETLREAVDLSAPVLKKNLAHLESAGAVEVGADGTLELAEQSLKQVKRALQSESERERDWERSRVEMMRLYAEERGCRRHFLLSYFGEDSPDCCGNCDNCAARQEAAAGEPASVEAGEAAADEPFGVGARVEHRSWGAGEVLRREDDKIVVVFDQAGYKTLALDLVRENDLLRPCE